MSPVRLGRTPSKTPSSSAAPATAIAPFAGMTRIRFLRSVAGQPPSQPGPSGLPRVTRSLYLDTRAAIALLADLPSPQAEVILLRVVARLDLCGGPPCRPQPGQSGLPSNRGCGDWPGI